MQVPPAPVSAEVQRLRARVAELEAQLGSARSELFTSEKLEGGEFMQSLDASASASASAASLSIEEIVARLGAMELPGAAPKAAAPKPGDLILAALPGAASEAVEPKLPPKVRPSPFEAPAPVEPAVQSKQQQEAASSGTDGAAGRPAAVRMIDNKDLQLDLQIGSGGYCIVYAAKWMGTRVAVKALRDNLRMGDDDDDAAVDPDSAEAAAGASERRVLEEASMRVPFRAFRCTAAWQVFGMHCMSPAGSLRAQCYARHMRGYK